MSLPTSAIAAESKIRSARSRKNEKEILRQASRVGQVGIARFCQVHESTISRLMPDVARFCDVLAALDLKVVSTALKCYDQETIDALFTLTRGRLNSIQSVEELAEDDPE